MAEQQANDKTATQQEQNITGLSQALAGILQGIGPGVQKDYSDAANSDAAFAKGFSDQMQQALGQRASNVSSFLTNVVGAPASQVASVAGQVAPPGAGDTLYGLRGFIPASNLTEEGAAETAAADQLPSIANSQGLQQIGKVQAAQNTADQGFADQLAKLAGTIPSVREKVANDLFNQQSKSTSLAIDLQKLQDSESNTAFNQNAKVATLNLDAKKFAQQTLNQNRNFQLSLARLGIENKRLQLATAANEFKLQNGGFTPAQVAKYDSLLQQGIDTMPAGTTYEQYVAKSVEHGVPISLAIEKANTHWVPTQRPAPQDLGNVLGISQQAASVLTGFGATRAAYDQMIGQPDKKGQIALATGPNGQTVKLQMPKSVTPALRTVIAGALEYLGTPYAWGGESPSGFDCSGLAQYLYGKAGVQIPRTTYDQFQAGVSVGRGQLQPGDLVFFRGSDSKTVNGVTLPGHVGIYVGSGQFVEAPHTGSVVKVSKLAGYPGFMGARRYGSK